MHLQPITDGPFRIFHQKRHQMHAVTAFMNEDVEKNIYMKFEKELKA